MNNSVPKKFEPVNVKELDRILWDVRAAFYVLIQCPSCLIFPGYEKLLVSSDAFEWVGSFCLPSRRYWYAPSSRSRWWTWLCWIKHFLSVLNLCFLRKGLFQSGFTVWYNSKIALIMLADNLWWVWDWNGMTILVLAACNTVSVLHQYTSIPSQYPSGLPLRVGSRGYSFLTIVLLWVQFQSSGETSTPRAFLLWNPQSLNTFSTPI